MSDLPPLPDGWVVIPLKDSSTVSVGREYHSANYGTTVREQIDLDASGRIWTGEIEKLPLADLLAILDHLKALAAQ